MKRWREERNYRGVRDDDGEFIAGTIKVDGEEIQVTPEVLTTYAQAERRERYMKEQYEQGLLVSLDYLREKHVPLERIEAALVSNPEDDLLKRLDQEQMWSRLVPVLNALDERDRAMIQALYFDGLSEREYAKQLGIHLKTLQKRRNKVIREIRRTIFE